MIQLALPQIDTRPTCPACKTPAFPLGQWAPGNRTYICRTCYRTDTEFGVKLLNPGTAPYGTLVEGVDIEFTPERATEARLRQSFTNAFNQLIMLG